MHILLIHQAFAAIDEAGGTRHHELALRLAERGHRLTIIASPVSYLTGKARTGAESSPPILSADAQPGVTILRTYTYSAWHRSFFHRLLSFFSFMLSSFVTGVRVKQVDVVWGTSPPIFQGLTAWALARLKGAPFLFEVRDLWPAFAVGVGVLRHRPLIIASQYLERFLYSHADLVMVNSPGFIAHVQQHGAHKVALLPNGSDPTMFDPDASGSEFRRVHDLESKFIALYAGAHGLSNDLNIVLDAAAILQARPEIAIVFLGDGKEKPALMERAARLGLQNVRFLPPLPKLEMAQALAAADACIAILKPIEMYKTVYPNKVFDYMAAGRAVILAIDGVIREVVEGCQAGVFVPPGDAQRLAEAIAWLADNPQAAQTMGRNGRKTVEERFSRDKLAEQLAGILDSLRRKP